MSDAKSERPWPTKIKLKKSERVLEVSFEDGATFSFPAEYLRVESPSAEVQGHGTGSKTTVPGKRFVTIEAVEPVGNYALRLVFGDGHDSGLFTWETFYRLGREHDKLWAEYLAALEAKGLNRG